MADETKDFQELAKAHEPIGRVTFEGDDVVRYVYDYDILKLDQIESARSVYYFGIEQAKTPPDSISKLFLSGGHNITLRAFGYLLRRLDAEGHVQPFTAEEAQGHALAFVRNLTSKDYTRLLECQEDFFTRARVSDLELIRQSRAYAAAQEGLRIELNDLVRNALHVSKKSLESARSMQQENSAAGSSTKGGTAASSGSSPTSTKRSSMRRGR